tara:strand:+ start:585 stop:989 length:405 start_codon:yes stop_codon:yes gene_type:complete
MGAESKIIPIEYRELRKWKYQLTHRYNVHTSIIVPENISSDYIYLRKSGIMTISKHYAWDGATWFPDFKTIIRPSLVHDAFCQLMEEGKLLRDPYRKKADKLLKDMCRAEGMSGATSYGVYTAVRSYSKLHYGV